MEQKKTGEEKRIFVVHEHHARNLHFDLRLQFGHVLRSWAVPKEPPEVEGVKRLAILVDDHALTYAKFEGNISEGYGKGDVKIWDSGTFDLESEHDTKLVFILHGKKLEGRYTLLKFPKAKNGWLFFKDKEKQ
jgi:DNA ligase D-like protein (predicted 3'-phosphoesterase)